MAEILDFFRVFKKIPYHFFEKSGIIISIDKKDIERTAQEVFQGGG